MSAQQEPRAGNHQRPHAYYSPLERPRKVESDENEEKSESSGMTRRKRIRIDRHHSQSHVCIVIDRSPATNCEFDSALYDEIDEDSNEEFGYDESGAVVWRVVVEKETERNPEETVSAVLD